MIQWQGLEAQEFVIQSYIEEDVHLEKGYRSMYDSRAEYFIYLYYQTFKQKSRQEVETKKY